MSETSTCDIELLLSASQLTYAIKKNDAIVLEGETSDITEKNRQIALSKKYEISTTIAPKTIGGTGDQAFSAIVLCPKNNDDQSPIVIAFKGTNFKQYDDVYADLHICSTGVAPKKYRDAVYNYYTKVRQEYPNRKIIITGHSLAGNLSQYVGAKAYNDNNEQIGMLEIRTFNTAPINTRHDKILKKNKEISNHFINYRAQHDLISNNPAVYHQDGKGYGFYGTMINLTNTNNDHYKAHLLINLKKLMPKNLINQVIGNSHTQLEEEHAIGVIENMRYRINKLINQNNSTTLKKILEILDNETLKPQDKIQQISTECKIDTKLFTKHIKKILKNNTLSQQLQNLLVTTRSYIIEKLYTTIKWQLLNFFADYTTKTQKENTQSLPLKQELPAIRN